MEVLNHRSKKRPDAESPGFRTCARTHSRQCRERRPVGEANDHDGATERVLGLGGGVIDEHSLDRLLTQVVLLARHTVGRADAVSITMAENGGFRTTTGSDPEARAVDEAQYEENGGPCLDAVRSARQVEVAVETDGDQWPGVKARAREFGITSVLSTPLLRGDDAIGALNIYSRAGAGFGDDEHRTAGIIGNHGATLVATTQALIGVTNLNEQLRAALVSREIIGEAKGIIMERQTCTRDEAFDILRRASQRENRKLRDLAEELVLRVEARRRNQPRS
jgi:transcriptional regulator with GAF, ATPase, and Fis domain